MNDKDKQMNEKENPLQLTWCNHFWLHLNQHNVLNYFADKTNIFYDHTCNNEHLKMRGLPLRELEKMKGVEYILLQAQEPILYVIRKQLRHSPTSVVPLANYYIIAGFIYQAPDLKSFVESRLLTAIHSLQSAFEECFNYARFHPSLDYYWSFDRDSGSLNQSSSSSSNNKQTSESDSGTAASGSNSNDPVSSKKDLAQRKEMLITDASDSMRARYRQSVDALIRDLYFKFPPLEQKPVAVSGTATTTTTNNNTNNQSQTGNSNQTSSTSNNQENNQNDLNQNNNNKSNDNNSMKRSTVNGTSSSSTSTTIKTENEDENYERKTQKSQNSSSSSGGPSMKKPKFN